MEKVIKKHLSYVPYIVFALITLLYVRIIVSLYRSIEAARDGGFEKLFEADFPVWYYKSADNLILYDKILILFFILMYFLSVFIRKKYILSLFILLLPLIFMFCDWLYLRYTITYKL